MAKNPWRFLNGNQCSELSPAVAHDGILASSCSYSCGPLRPHTAQTDHACTCAGGLPVAQHHHQMWQLSRHAQSGLCRPRPALHCLQCLPTPVPPTHIRTQPARPHVACRASSDDLAPAQQQQLSSAEQESVLQQLEQLRR